MRKLTLLALLTFLCASANATDVSFTNGGQFDNDTDGSAAVFADATITTVSLGGSATALNENAGLLGATGGASNTRWDSGESWTFEFNKAVSIDTIGFNVFGSVDDEATLQSADWIGLGFIENDVDLSFNDTTGAFTFTGGTNRNFDLATIVTGGVSLSASSDLTFSSTGTSNFEITALKFTVVPEPQTYALLACFCGLFGSTLRRCR